MYTREIKDKRHGPLENGIPLQGTWTIAFEEVNLLDVHKPYSIPLPKGLKDLRIKEWESFTIQDERFYIKARLSNLKFFHEALVIIYDKENGERQVLQKFVPGGSWRLPKGLYNASVDSRSYGFFFRIHNWLDTNSIKLELDIRERGKRPAFTAHAAFDLARDNTTPMSVSLLFSERRSMYSFKALAAVTADVVTGGRHIRLTPSTTSGLFCDFKGYFPYRFRSTWAEGMGFDSENRRFGFTLSENQCKEQFMNNENALWINGDLTPLPPVKITRSGGADSDWIIQDMEGMVDLIFSPKDNNRGIKNFIFAHADYETPLGIFNGKMLNAHGEELPIKNIWGSIEKISLRL